MKNKFLILVIGGILGIFVGFLGEYFFVKNTISKLEKEKKECEIEIEKSKKEIERLEKVIKKILPPPKEIFALGGKVIKVKTNSLIIEVPQIHPLENTPTQREVILTKETKIVKVVPKSPEKYEKEMKQYRLKEKELFEKQKKGIAIEKWPSPPEPFEEKEIELKEIKVGDEISVISKEDIKFAKKFEVVKIKLLEE